MAIDNNRPTGFMAGLWHTVSGFFEVAFTKVWGAYQETVIRIFQDSTTLIREGWDKTEELKWNEMLSLFEKEKWIDAETKQQLMKLRDLPKGGDIVSYFGVFLLLVLKQVTTFSEVIGSDIRRNLNVQHRPSDASAGELIHAAFLDPKRKPEIEHILAQLGLPEKQIELLFLSFHRAYDESTIRTLYLREVITEAQVYEKMKVIGYNKELTTEMIQAWPVIPSLGDIVRYIAKEAFEPQMIELFGLLEGYPVEAEEWAAKQGLSKRWVEAEWVAHWRDLGIDFMLEAYHRHIVDWPLVERYMALIEIPPKLREIVKDTAFRVYTRVDVRRMHDIGVLSDAELVIAYQDQGYDDDKAVKMAEFTIRYNNEHQRDLTKAEILKGYTERLIQRTEAKMLLMEMEYSDSEAEYLLIYEDYKFDKKLQDKKLANIQFRFVNNFITKPQTITQLNTLALRGEQITVLIEEWEIDVLEDRKLPSKTDLDKFIKAKIIDEDIYTTEMTKLGYNAEYIRWYWKLLKKK